MTLGITASLDRLETLVDGAILAMERGEALDDGATASAKGRALLELSRQKAPAADGERSEALAAQVARVRGKLAREQELLRLRLQAAELIAELVADAVMTEEWDGTYSAHPAGVLTGGRARP